MAPSARIDTKQRISADAVADGGGILGTSSTAENYPATIPDHLANYAKAFEDAAENIDIQRGDATSEGTSFGGQTGNVAVWANANGKLIPTNYFAGLEVISDSTSEHKVYFRPLDNRALKKTWAGVYGQVPCPKSGKLDRENASPAEYLRRMALQIRIFWSDIKLEGVHISDEPSMIIGQPSGEPAFVISQAWLDKSGVAKNEEISDFLVGEGFKEVPGSYYGWYRAEDGVVIVDAKPDNFIRTVAGIVPIDLQIAIFEEIQVTSAGLDNLEETSKATGQIIQTSEPA